MADFQVTFVQAGRDLLAANRGSGDPTPVSYLEIGEGTTAPTLADTGIETAFAAPIRFADPTGSAIGDSFTFLLDDGEARTYTLYEVGWFSGGSAGAGGGTLLHRVVIATGLVKPLNARLHYPLVGRILGEALDTLTFMNTLATPTTPDWTELIAGKVERASETEAERTGGHSNEKGLSVLRGWQQVGAWWASISVPVSKLTGVVPRAQIPDATATQGGKVELSTSSEVRTAVGADPATGVQDNVVTLQGIFGLIKAYEDGDLPNAVPPDSTIEIVYES